MFSTVSLLLAVVVLLLAVFGVAAIGSLGTIPLGLALGFASFLFGKFNL